MAAQRRVHSRPRQFQAQPRQPLLARSACRRMQARAARRFAAAGSRLLAPMRRSRWRPMAPPLQSRVAAEPVQGCPAQAAAPIAAHAQRGLRGGMLWAQRPLACRWMQAKPAVRRHASGGHRSALLGAVLRALRSQPVLSPPPPQAPGLNSWRREPLRPWPRRSRSRAARSWRDRCGPTRIFPEIAASAHPRARRHRFSAAESRR